MGIIDALGHAALDKQTLHFEDGAELTATEAWLLTLGAPLATDTGLAIQALITPARDSTLRDTLAEDWGVQDRASFEAVVQWLVDEGHRHACFTLWTAMRKIGDERRRANPLLRLFAAGLVETQAHRNADAARLAADTGMEPRAVAERLVDSQQWVDRIDKAMPIDGGVRSFVAWDAVRLVSLSRSALQLGWIERTEFVDHADRLSDAIRAAYGTWSEVAAAYAVAGLVWSYSPERERELVRVARWLDEDPRSPFQRQPFA